MDGRSSTRIRAAASARGKPTPQRTCGTSGHGDLRDILAGIDAAYLSAYRRSASRPHRGYGGIMTMWAVTQTQRFRAGVAAAGISNWISYYGENGINEWMLPFFGSSAYEDPDVYARSSAISHIRNVRTPTFAWVGERDVECPAPQTQELARAEGARYSDLDSDLPGGGPRPSRPGPLAGFNRTDACVVRQISSVVPAIRSMRFLGVCNTWFGRVPVVRTWNDSGGRTSARWYHENGLSRRTPVSE